MCITKLPCDFDFAQMNELYGPAECRDEVTLIQNAGEAVYCPNGCEDSCSNGGCAAGQRGTDAHCK